ncbi:MAG: efflux transporter outer membrane subunit [Bacteroidales bacterium]|nr:efflux transporter outer membrane subunit [Bacteroidales bacterium]
MKKIYGFIVLLLILGSCVGPKYTEPENNIEESYKQYMYDTLVSNEDTIINLRWWEFIKEPSLDTLIRHALVYNKDVLMAATRIEQSRAIMGMTRADQYPGFSLSGGALQSSSSGVDNYNYNVGVGMNWELVFWGRYRAAAEGARADLAASEFGMRSIQMSIISDVTQYYALVLDLKNRLEISKKTLGSRDSAVLIIEARFNGGVVPEIDLNQAQINQAIAAAAVPNYMRQLAIAQNALAVIIGEHPREIITDNEQLDSMNFELDIPYGIPSTLLLRRPDILASREAYHAQFKQINVAVAQRFPSISITGMFGGSSMALGTLTGSGVAWSAGASLLGPIFEFGKNKRRVDVARAQAKEALYRYENTVNQSFREVEDALVSIKTLKLEIEAKEREAKAAINAEYLSKLRYDKGVASYLEVLDNQRSSFNAQLGLSSIKRQLIDAYIGLYKALGGGWLSAEEEEQAKNNEANTDTTKK